MKPRRKRPDGPRAGARQAPAPAVATLPARVPLLPLRDLTIFPGMTLPLYVNRRASIAALQATAEPQILLAAAQLRPEVEQPEPGHLHAVGCLLRVLQQTRLADGSLRILVTGVARARVAQPEARGEFWDVAVTPLPERPRGGTATRDLAGAVREAFREYAGLSRRVPAGTLTALASELDPTALSFRVAAHVSAGVVQKQAWLEAPGAAARLALLRSALDAWNRALRSEQVPAVRPAGLSRPPRPHGRPAEGVESPDASGGRATPGFRCIEGGAAGSAEAEELAAAIAAARMPARAREKAHAELDRLCKMPYGTPEATVTRTYLDWMVRLPWRRRSRDRTDLGLVQTILDEDHFGLEKVKERIVEHIAVLKLSGEVRGPILCLCGPPGVGKTSLGRSIARALGRRFARMSLGGVSDEAEIRGHRRTYVGSLPGRVLQAMRRAGTVNPVILLDEVDKLGRDHRGDPAAALLEVLDPEQNRTFADHYLEVEYDLSRALFVTTANVLPAIPEPLRDRMEVIALPGYLEGEKLEIARRFLWPRQIASAGLTALDLAVSDPALLRVVREYTREAGVRGLDRELARLCRRVAMVKAGGSDRRLAPFLARTAAAATGGLGLTLGPDRLEALLGAPPHMNEVCDRRSRVGVATGLAWTEAGGELLTIEAGVLPGGGSLILTGQLGPTLRESAQAALSYIRSRAAGLGLSPDFYRRLDLHLHIPEGAVPKDGPSAGAAIALAMVSALTGIPTRPEVGMTGEISLRGNVLPVGGLAEKLVAARRGGLGTVLFPSRNRVHVDELPAPVRAGLCLRCVDSMDEVLAAGLEERPAELHSGPIPASFPLASVARARAA